MKKKLILLLLILFLLIIFICLIVRKKRVKESFSLLDNLDISKVISNITSGVTMQNIQNDIAGITTGVAELATNPVAGAMTLAQTGMQIYDQVQGVSTSESGGSDGTSCKQSGCSTCIFGETKKCAIDDCNTSKSTCYQKWDDDLNNAIDSIIMSGLNSIFLINLSGDNTFETRIQALNTILSNIQDGNKKLVNINDGLFTTQKFMITSSDYKTNLSNKLVQLSTSSLILSKLVELLNVLNKYYEKIPSNEENNLIIKSAVSLKLYIVSEAYNQGSTYTNISFSSTTNIIKYSNDLVNQALGFSVVVSIYQQTNNDAYPALVRDSLITFKILVTTGSFPIGLPNSTSSVYVKVSNNLSSIMGDKYLTTGNPSDSNSEISSDMIPYNISLNAYDNDYYNTLESCNNSFKSAQLALPLNIKERLDELNRIKDDLINSQLTTHNPQGMKTAIEEARAYYFNEQDGKWRTVETSSTYNPCSPININSNTIGSANTSSQYSSNFFSFEDVSKELELQRKKILNIRENIYKSLYGNDVTFNYVDNPRTPNCPKVFNNENTNVLEWQRDTTQSSLCVASPYLNEQDHSLLQGTMKPGELNGNTDTWLENVNTIKNNIDNLAAVSQTSSLYKYTTIDPTSTDLWRAGGNMIQKVLQDRDWSISSQKWNQKKLDMDNLSATYIKENILNFYNKDSLDIGDNFNVIYDLDNVSFKQPFSKAFIPDNTIIQANNITFNNKSSDKQGIVRIYKNMYQYNDYDTSNNGQILPSTYNKVLDIFSLIFSYSYWTLNDFLDDEKSLYIICHTNIGNGQNSNWYSNNNNLLGINPIPSVTQLYYSSKRANILHNEWKIMKNNDKDFYLYNIKSKVYIAWGSSCESYKNIEDGKKLYLIPKEKIERNCLGLGAGENEFYCNQLKLEASWNIVNIGPNKYNIFTFDGSQLWFSGNTFKVYPKNKGNPNTDIIRPLGQDLGWIGVTSNTSTGNNNVPEWCITGNDGNSCYNSIFVIVPVEPIDITLERDIKRGTIDKNKYNKCSTIGTRLESNDTWFKEITKEFTTSYADRDSSGNISDKTSDYLTKNTNPFKNIYDSYTSQNEIITSVTGGKGDECAEYNYCKIDSRFKNSEDQLEEESTGFLTEEGTNEANQSNNISVKYFKNNKLNNWKVVKAPIQRFNYTCKKRDFMVFQLGNDNMKIEYNSPINQLIKLPQDDINNDLEDIQIILLLWSINNQKLNGIDYGISPRNNYIWWKNDVDIDSLRYLYGNRSDIMKKYTIIDNANAINATKKSKKTILLWNDIYKFIYSGYSSFQKGQLYAYRNNQLDLNES